MKHILIFLAALATVCNAAVVDPTEAQVIADCLESFGGLTIENEERLQRYKQWSDTYEEIPCFTHCYLSKMFDIYDETQGFNHAKVEQMFGSTLLSTCRSHLMGRSGSCVGAYQGFHCLTTLEDDPFIVIENKQNISSPAKVAMKDCLRRFDRYEWTRMRDYAKFPVHEPIPCYTKCFLERLHLYSQRDGEWNLNGMREHLGVPKESASLDACTRLRRRRNRNSCNWMYQEFTCFVMAT